MTKYPNRGLMGKEWTSSCWSRGTLVGIYKSPGASNQPRVSSEVNDQLIPSHCVKSTVVRLLTWGGSTSIGALEVPATACGWCHRSIMYGLCACSAGSTLQRFPTPCICARSTLAREGLRNGTNERRRFYTSLNRHPISKSQPPPISRTSVIQETFGSGLRRPQLMAPICWVRVRGVS